VPGQKWKRANFLCLHIASPATLGANNGELDERKTVTDLVTRAKY
jgi:hypothetical protein